jgi:hypothetical protein
LNEQTADQNSTGFQFLKAEDAFQNFQRLLFVFNRNTDQQLFEKMCRYIISSMLNEQNADNKK